jgi:hypothetical protein
LGHFTGLWDAALARPLAEGASVLVALVPVVGLAVVVGSAVGEVVPVGVAVVADVATGVLAAAGRPVLPEAVRGAVGREFSYAAPELALPAAWPLPAGESGVVARGVAGCVVSGSGTNGALMVGPPSNVLTSSAT